MKKAITALAVIVAAALGYGAWRWFRGGESNAIRLSGNIELTEVDVSFKLPGKLIERAVDEGDTVKRGMVLAQLDQQELIAQRDRAKAALAAAESIRRQTATGVKLQRETVEAQIEQRAAEIRAMEAKLEELVTGSREEEKRQVRAAVDRAEAEAERASKDFERMQTLYKSENISASELDQYRARRDTAAAALREAQQQQAIVMDGPRKETIEAARAQLAQARATLRLAEAQRLELKRREEELKTRASEIEQRRAELALIESQLSDTVAISPIDGVVLAKGAEPGEVLAAGTTVLTVGDIGHPWVRAYISETDLGRVKIGSKARVTTDSFPGKVYEGRVSFIASQAEFTPKQIQTPEERAKLMYRVKIDVENPKGELKSNMPADAEIVL